MSVGFKKSVLPNGVTLLTEHHPHAMGVSVGVWVKVGSRNEKPQYKGITHFLEHLVFKGTKSKSAFEIAKSLERFGGELNALTSKEYTIFHAYVLNHHIGQAMEVLADLVSHMDCTVKDFLNEKLVVLQEIHMAEDNLEDIIYDYFLDEYLPKQQIASPILGSTKSITDLKLSDVKKFYQDVYTGSNIIVSVAGQVQHEDLLVLTKKYLSKKKKLTATRKKWMQDYSKLQFQPFRKCIEKPVEQLHFLMGFPSTSFKDPLRFEAFIVNAYLGGGMTSRLYQEVRENRGLVYDIHSSINSFYDGGMLNIYAACEPNNMVSVLKQIQKEVEKLLNDGMKQSAVDMFKTQVIGSIMLGADDMENRMQSIAVNEMVYGAYRAPEKVIAEIQKVSRSSVQKYLQKYINPKKIGAIWMGAQAEQKASELQSFWK